MIPRIAHKKIKQLAKQFKSVAIIGPRQSGKTTLVRSIFPDKPYVSLENPDQRRFAIEDPVQFINNFPDGAILDEIQRVPDLLSYLQQNLDEDQRRGKYIFTGSNNLLLLEKISQTLAGRVAYFELLPFSVDELSHISGALDDLNSVLFNGGYPELNTQHMEAPDWFSSYLRTYVERDVRQIKNISNLLIFEKLLALCAGRVGQQLNVSNLSNEVGMDAKTVQSWLGVLQAGYIIFLLPPYYKNFNKRVVKSPKLYFYDTGLASHLLHVHGAQNLFQHPYRGPLFENFIVTELLKNRYNQGKRSNLFYWRDSAANEVDVLVDDSGFVFPIEIKSGQTITNEYFKSLAYWKKLTGKEGGLVLYGGDGHQDRSSTIKVRSWQDVGSY